MSMLHDHIWKLDPQGLGPRYRLASYKLCSGWHPNYMVLKPPWQNGVNQIPWNLQSERERCRELEIPSVLPSFLGTNGICRENNIQGYVQAGNRSRPSQKWRGGAGGRIMEVIAADWNKWYACTSLFSITQPFPCIKGNYSNSNWNDLLVCQKGLLLEWCSQGRAVS